MTESEKKGYIDYLDGMSSYERHNYLFNKLLKSDESELREKLGIILDEYNFTISRELYIDTDCCNSDIIDLIIRGKVEFYKSEELGIGIRYCFENPNKVGLFESDSELLDRAIGWLSDVAESVENDDIRSILRLRIDYLNEHRMK